MRKLITALMGLLALFGMAVSGPATARSFPDGMKSVQYTLRGSDPRFAPIISVAGLGDSMTAGQGATAAATRYINVLQSWLGATTLSNQGISNTVLQNSPLGAGPLGTVGLAGTTNGRDRIVSAVLGANKTDMPVIQYGYNDARVNSAPSTFNVSEFTNDLEESLNAAIEGGYHRSRISVGSPFWIEDATLAGVGGYTPAQTRTNFEAYVTAAQTVAAEYGVRYAGVYEATTGHTEWVASDSVHPNDNGHFTIATTHLNSMITNTKPRPTLGVMTAPSSSSLTVTWGPPTSGNVTNYTVQAGFDGFYRFPNSTTATGTSTTLTGLPGGVYRTRIRANFSDSTSSPWEFSTSTVTVGTPADPLVFTSPTFQAGKFGHALTAGTALVPLTVIPTATVNLPFSVSFWASTTASVLQVAMSQKRGSGVGWYIGTDASGNAQAAIGSSSGTAANITTTTKVNDGAYHHFKMVFTSSGVTFFVDGTSVGSNATVLTSTNLNQATIRTNNGGNGWGGSTTTAGFDELSIIPGDSNTANFTPQTSAYTAGNGGIVYHMDDDGAASGLISFGSDLPKGAANDNGAEELAA